MTYLIVENGIITNTIVSDAGFATKASALPYYEGAEIGATYKPQEPPMTTEEMILDKLTEIEYRQDLMGLGLTQEGGAII